ncbi:MAG: hypothetical protein JJU11_08760 [Candidatus Sumerlaeia bacterium]|nr:hypothetical protein [Candidatus Sumerlaeia bacterium]
MKALEKKIAALLLSWKVLDEGKLQEALKDFDEADSLTEFLLAKGLVGTRDLARAKAEAEGLAFVALDETIPPEEALTVFTPEVAWGMEVVPIEFIPGEMLRIATTRAHDVYLEDEIKVQAGCPVSLVACEEADLMAALERYYGPHPEIRRSSSSSGVNRLPANATGSAVSRSNEHKKLLRSIRDSTTELNLSQMETQAFEESRDETLDLVEQERTVRGSYDAPTESSTVLSVSAMDPKSPRSLLAEAINTMIEEQAEELEIAPGTGRGMIRIRVANGWKEIGLHDAHKHKAMVSILRKTAGINVPDDEMPADHQFLIPTPKGRYLATLHLMKSQGWDRALVQVAESRPLLEAPLSMIHLPSEVAGSLEQRLKSKAGGLLLVTSPSERDVSWFLAGMSSWMVRSDCGDILSLERPHDRRIPGVTSINCPTVPVLLASLANVSFMKPDALFVTEVENGTILNRLFHVAQRGTTVVAGMTSPDPATAGACLRAANVEEMNIVRGLAGHLHVMSIPALCPDCIRPLQDDEEAPDWVPEAQRPNLRKADGGPKCNDTGRAGLHWVGSLYAPDKEKADGSILEVTDGMTAARQIVLDGLADPDDLPHMG